MYGSWSATSAAVELGDFPTSHKQAVVDSHRRRPAVARQQRVPRLGRGVARHPEEYGAEILRDVEDDDEHDDEPFHPAVRQPEQRDGERRLARGHRENRHEARGVALEAKRHQVHEWYLHLGEAEPETDIGCGRRAADEEGDLGGTC